MTGPSFAIGAGNLIAPALACGMIHLVGLACWCRSRALPLHQASHSLVFSLGAASAIPILMACQFLPRAIELSLLVAIVVVALFPWWSFRTLARYPPPPTEVWSRSRLVGFVLLLVPIVLAFPVLLRPPLNYDVLSYHLPIAHELRASGGFGYIEANYYSRLPLGAFLLYRPLLPNRIASIDDPGVGVLLLVAMIACAGLCSRIAGHLGGRRLARWAAAALWLWHPMVWGSFLNYHTDILTALFGFAAFERLLSASVTRRPISWATAGFLAGSAVAVKFSAAGIVAVPMLLAGGTLAFARHDARQAARAVALMIAGLLAAYGPWMLRAWILGGHPLHPFAGSAPGWTAEQAAFLLEQHRPLSVFSAEYWQHLADKLPAFGYPIRATGISLALLMAFLALARRRRGKAAVLLAAALAGFAAWGTVGIAPDRFILPSVALVLVLAALSLEVRLVPRVAVQRAIRGLLALLLVLSIVGSGPLRHGVVSPVHFAGLYLRGWFPELWDRSGLVPEGLLYKTWMEGGWHSDHRTLLLFEARQRWFPPGSVAHTVWDVPPWAEELKASTSGRDLAERLRLRRYSQIVVNEWEFGRLLDFYGGQDFAAGWGSVGLAMPEEEYLDLLESWPPGRFAGFTRQDYRHLREFLLLSRQHATVTVPAGPVAEIWLAPIPIPEDGDPNSQ